MMIRDVINIIKKSNKLKLNSNSSTLKLKISSTNMKKAINRIKLVFIID
jgi:hypothetical protein